MLRNLSIITITYNNVDEFIKTYSSIAKFREQGVKHIIINGGKSIKSHIQNDCKLIEESDSGIYDALNKGISNVKTKYFMIIHSGDILITDPQTLSKQILLLDSSNHDILLNDCKIEFKTWSRNIRSKYWKSWMFSVGVSPPHPPIIYKLESVKNINYNLSQKVIADFFYLEHLICTTKLSYIKGNKLLIAMSPGGKTSSGIVSFITVSKGLIKEKGIFRSLLFFTCRPFIKVLQMI